MASSKVPPALAKISAPRPHAVLERPRLFRALDKARHARVVWLVDAAGGGKTTLVSSYLRARRLRAIWYRMDRLDADPGRLFHHLSFALEQLRAGRRSALPKPMRGSQASEFALRYFEAFFSELPDGVLLVLDDFQEAGAEGIWQTLVAEAIRAVRPGTNLFVLSRDEPSHALARHGLDAELARLGGAELRLTEAELAALVRRRFPRQRGLNAPLLARVHAVSAGWAAGAILLLESLASVDSSLPELEFSPERVFAYMASEIFDRAPPETQSVLLETAVLPSFSLALADALNATELLPRVLTREFGLHHFVERQGTEHGREATYRYHPLFRAFLLHRAEQTLSARELAALRSNAGALLAASGRPEEAVELFALASDLDGIARLVLRDAALLLSSGRSRTLADWLALLPLERVESDGWLSYWDGQSRLGGDPKRALSAFERALGLFERARDVEGGWLTWSAGVQAIVFEGSDFRRLDPWLERAEQLFDGPRTLATEATEARVVSAITLALVYRGRGPEARSWVERALSLARSISDPDLKLSLMGTIHVYCAMQGDVVRSALLTELLQGAQIAGDTSPLVRLLAIAGEVMVASLQGRERASLDAVQRGLSMLRAAAASHLADRLLLYGSLAAIGLGERQTTRDFVEQLGKIAAAGQPFDVGSYYYAASCEALDQGDLALAAHAADAALEVARAIDVPRFLATSALLSACVQIELGRFELVASLLTEVHALEQSMQSELLSYWRGMIEADVCLRRGQSSAALSRMTEAFAAARACGAANCHPLRRKRFAELCVVALEAGIEPEHVARSVRRLQLFPADPPVLVARWPWRFRVWSLGRFELWRDGEPAGARGPQPVPLKVLQVLLALGAYGGRRVPAERVIDAVWPDLEGDAGGRAFDTALHRLRRLLGDDEVIELNRGQVALSPEHCWVDLWALEALAQRDTGPEPWLALYEGAFLASESELAAFAPMRRRAEARFVNAMLRIGQSYERAGAPERAVDLYRRALELALGEPERLNAALRAAEARFERALR